MKLEEAFQALRRKNPRQVAEEAIKAIAESRLKEKEQSFTLGDMISEENKNKLLKIFGHPENTSGVVNGRFRENRVVDKSYIRDSL